MRCVVLVALAASAMAGCAAELGPEETVIYLNREGATLTAGDDDAAANVSSQVGDKAVIPAAQISDGAWSEVISCVRAAYAPFAVTVTDSRPADAGYTMAVFGGNGSQLGLGVDQHGIAPFGCDTIDRAIAFVFTENFGSDTAKACEIAVHELAHTFSIDHSMTAADPTSYLAFTGRRAFQDIDAPCGETAERECACGGKTQSSYRRLLERLGPSAHVDAIAPSVSVSAAPSSRGTLSIQVNAIDDSGLSTVSLAYSDAATSFVSTCGDGRVPCTRFGDDYTFVIAGASGMATFQGTAADIMGNRASTEMTAQQVN